MQRQQGFKNVYKLEGGVQHYGNVMAEAEAEADEAAAADGAHEAAAGDEAAAAVSDEAALGDETAFDEAVAAGETSDDAIPHWKGSLFVFDRRNTVRFGAAAVPGAAAAEPIGTCQHCNVASESFINCCNVDCNRLHLVCPACLASHRGEVGAPQELGASQALPQYVHGVGQDVQGVAEPPRLATRQRLFHDRVAPSEDQTSIPRQQIHMSNGIRQHLLHSGLA